ncbi:MAG: hypothetical protein HY323_12705 [Betaproteobacteria bacterium]|nr:hypothetical protein [Betaproteobacteria bacterium]
MRIHCWLYVVRTFRTERCWIYFSTGTKRKSRHVDVKKIWIGTDLKLAATGAKVSHLNLNPWVLGIGLGWRF